MSRLSEFFFERNARFSGIVGRYLRADGSRLDSSNQFQEIHDSFVSGGQLDGEDSNCGVHRLQEVLAVVVFGQDLLEPGVNSEQSLLGKGMV